jgi:membrane protease YdiL (CAAX protease family)
MGVIALIVYIIHPFILARLILRKGSKAHEYLILAPLVYIIGLPILLILILTFLFELTDSTIEAFTRGYFQVTYFFMGVFVVGLVLFIKGLLSKNIKKRK